MYSMKTVGFHHYSATILDFMAIIQSTIQKKVGTFGQLLDNLKSSVSWAFQESNIIVLIPDRYDVEQSVKSAERSRQQQCVGQEVLISSETKTCHRIFHHIFVIQIVNQILQNSSSRPASFKSGDLCDTTKSPTWQIMMTT